MEKTRVVLLLDQSNQVKGIRVGQETLPVAFGGPTIVNGTMGVSLSIENCDIEMEKLPAEAALSDEA